MSEIRTIDDLKRDLHTLPELIVRDLFPDALAAGGAVIEAELLARTPYDSDAPQPHLRDDIGTTVEIDRLQGSARTGFAELGQRALELEYGFAMTSHQPRHRFIRQVRGVGFMRRAADSIEDAAVDAFSEALNE